MENFAVHDFYQGIYFQDRVNSQDQELLIDGEVSNKTLKSVVGDFSVWICCCSDDEIGWSVRVKEESDERAF